MRLSFCFNDFSAEYLYHFGNALLGTDMRQSSSSLYQATGLIEDFEPCYLMSSSRLAERIAALSQNQRSEVKLLSVTV